MEKVQLDTIYDFTIDFKSYINECEHEGRSINNKTLDNSNDIADLIRNLLKQYDIYKNHYFNKPDFFHSHSQKFSNVNMMLDNRSKNNASLGAKVVKNLDADGHFYFRKITNDIIGARVIFDTTLSIKIIEKTLIELFSEIKEIKIINSSKKVGYKAVHIYISNGSMLPVELQIWRRKDQDENHRLHSIYKQNHFKERND